MITGNVDADEVVDEVQQNQGGGTADHDNTVGFPVLRESGEKTFIICGAEIDGGESGQRGKVESVGLNKLKNRIHQQQNKIHRKELLLIQFVKDPVVSRMKQVKKQIAGEEPVSIVKGGK